MTLVWTGDFSTGDAKQYAGGWEYHGSTQPPPPEYVAVAKDLNGVKPPPGCTYFARIQVHPGDTYGGSTGWRTLGRVGANRPQGYESWFVWAQLIPADYPGDIDALVAPFEYHQTQAPNVAVTGPAPINIAANHAGDGMFVTVKGGSDGKWTEYVKTTVDPGYPRNVWSVYTTHVKLDPVAGTFGFYLVDEPLIVKDCGTMYEQTESYALFGGYRNQVGADVMRFYLAGCREYSTADEAFAWARTLAGRPAARPIHDAVAKISAKANPNIRHAFDLIADRVEP